MLVSLREFNCEAIFIKFYKLRSSWSTYLRTIQSFTSRNSAEDDAVCQTDTIQKNQSIRTKMHCRNTRSPKALK